MFIAEVGNKLNLSVIQLDGNLAEDKKNRDNRK